MEWMNEMWRRLVFLFRRRRMEEELAEEMRLHVELRAVEDGADGARRRFGNETLLREQGREVWGWQWLDSIIQDLRYGVRNLAGHPAFALTAIASLALGIGANTAIFSILNAVMLRELPVEDPSRLVEVRTGDNAYFTNPIWEAVRDRQQVFNGMLAYSDAEFDLSAGGERQMARGIWVSGDYFRVLGVPAWRGRMITPEDDTRGGGKHGPVAVISHKMWVARYQSDEAIIGKQIRLDGHQFTIVGVTPPWFHGLQVDTRYDVAIPICSQLIMNTETNVLEHRSWWWLRILGRLGPERTLMQANAGLQAISKGVRQVTVPPKWATKDQAQYLLEVMTARQAGTGFSSVGDRYRKALFTLMAVVGLVLLIACANVANLLLARAAARQKEISIRMSIGAGRARVLRQLLTESVMLAVLGAAAGTLLAHWGSTFLVGMMSTTRDPLALDVSPDWRVLLFTMSVALLTALLFGLAPAFLATMVDPNVALKEKARGAVSGNSRFGAGKLLVAGQVGLSLMLLVAAGLFLSSMRHLLTQPAGFDPRNVLLVQVDTLGKVPKGKRTSEIAAVLRRVRQVPGVMSAATGVIPPISGMTWNNFTFPDGYTSKSQEDTLAYFNRVSPGYFRAMGMTLVAGRDFAESDTKSSTWKMILSESAARRFFGGSNAVGRMVGTEEAPGTKRVMHEVIGVVKDAKYNDMKGDSSMTAYLAMDQDDDPFLSYFVAVRAAGDKGALTGELRRAVADVNSGLSLEFVDFERRIHESLSQERTVASLSTFFGALALVLAMVGLYGVMAYTVVRRQAEIGIRMALGASNRSVVWLIMRDVLLMLASGLTLGVVASLAAGKLVTSLLYGVKPSDPATLTAAVLVLALATALAGYLPARRASRLEPTVTLREE
jgi:predicted permease